ASLDASSRAREYCDELLTVPLSLPDKGTPAYYGALLRNLTSRLPYAVARYRSSAMREAIAHAVHDRGIDLLVCDFLVPAVNVPVGLGVPAMLFQHNVEAAIWTRRAQVARSFAWRAYLAEQSRRMHAFERQECRRFDHVISVSEVDRDTFPNKYGVAQGSAIPTGGGVDFFRPSVPAAAPTRGNRLRRIHGLDAERRRSRLVRDGHPAPRASSHSRCEPGDRRAGSDPNRARAGRPRARCHGDRDGAGRPAVSRAMCGRGSSVAC